MNEQNSMESTVLWTEKDAINGWCKPEQVGHPVQNQSTSDSDPASDDNLDADERVKQACKEHGVDILDIPAVTRLMFRLWPYSFSKTHGALVRGEADRVDAEKAQRQSRDARLADLSATKLKAMNDGDIWLKVILAVQRHTGADQFIAILEECGITPADLQAMIEAGELTE